MDLLKPIHIIGSSMLECTCNTLKTSIKKSNLQHLEVFFVCLLQFLASVEVFVLGTDRFKCEASSPRRLQHLLAALFNLDVTYQWCCTCAGGGGLTDAGRIAAGVRNLLGEFLLRASFRLVVLLFVLHQDLPHQLHWAGEWYARLQLPGAQKETNEEWEMMQLKHPWRSEISKRLLKMCCFIGCGWAKFKCRYEFIAFSGWEG